MTYWLFLTNSTCVDRIGTEIQEQPYLPDEQTATPEPATRAWVAGQGCR